MVMKVKFKLPKLPGFQIQDLSLKRLSSKAGKIPGTVEYIGDHTIPLTINHLSYSPDDVFEDAYKSVDKVFTNFNETKVHWLDIIGLSNTTEIQELCNHFKVHPLIQEDVVNVVGAESLYKTLNLFTVLIYGCVANSPLRTVIMFGQSFAF